MERCLVTEQTAANTLGANSMELIERQYEHRESSQSSQRLWRLRVWKPETGGQRLEARDWRPETEDQNLDAHRKAPLGSGGVLYNSKWPTSKQIAQSENPSFHGILYYNKFFEAFLWYILVFEKLSSSSLFLGTPKGLKGARRCSPTRLAKKSYPFTLRHLAIQIFCGYDRQ